MLLVTAAALRNQAEPVYHLSSSALNRLTMARTVELNGLAMRRYWREQGGGLQEWFMSQLDPVSVPVAEQKPWTPGNLSRWAKRAQKAISSVNLHKTMPAPLYEVAGLPIEQAQAALAGKLKSTHRTMRRIDTMLDLYQPFIHDNDWTFLSDNVMKLSRALGDQEADLAFAVEDIDWCDYWVNVEVPGLRKWSIPILEGESIPDDPPSDPPLSMSLPKTATWSAK
jgi:hypothetical protein